MRGASIHILFVVLLFWMIPIFHGFAEEDSILIDDFESGLKPRWDRKSFKGKTIYSVIEMEGKLCLKAESRASASGLIYKLKYKTEDYPILTWRWKVEKTLEKGDASKREGDDYAARVYVVFPHWIPIMTRSINYIWANKLPRGSHISNIFHSNSIMVAVQSGEENAGRWVTEKRNVYEDYKMLFGTEPPTAGGIAIMTDTDNTSESAVAYYDDLMIEKLP